MWFWSVFRREKTEAGGKKSKQHDQGYSIIHLLKVKLESSGFSSPREVGLMGIVQN